MADDLRISGGSVQVREAGYSNKGWKLGDWIFFPLSSVSHFQVYDNTIGEDLEVLEISFKNGNVRTVGLDGTSSQGDVFITKWRASHDTN